MDNIPSMPPPSYLPPMSQFLVMPVVPIPLTIPRPFYWTPLYNYHGLTFNVLPPHVQSFLASHGLATQEQYSGNSVASLRAQLTDQLACDVRGVSEAIAHTTVRYNFMRTISPACDPALGELVAFVRRTLLPTLERHLAEHLALADGLVWADVAARGDFSTEQALHRLVTSLPLTANLQRKRCAVGRLVQFVINNRAGPEFVKFPLAWHLLNSMIFPLFFGVLDATVMGVIARAKKFKLRLSAAAEPELYQPAYGQALHYRFLQTQPALEMVATHLVELYEWSAQRWMMGWRTTYEAQTEAQTVFYESPVFNAPGPPQFDAAWGGPPQPDTGASPGVKDAAGVNLQLQSRSPRSPPTSTPPSVAPHIIKGPSASSVKGSAASGNPGRRRWGNSALRKARKE
ncbi:hypothetical protein C8R46DRAFT_1222590 [Mycena filopes]|nr:hypothetical protein C8R46DRAFT_1222590 [Mycena filopes]